MATKRCIYCLEDKPEEAYNAEHVVPQAFGKFEGNLVLHCVCEECNSFFSKDLELKLARDAYEGFDRFRKGLKPSKEYRSLGKRSTSYIEVIQDGPMKGVRCKVTHVNGALCPEPLPQMGFALSEEGPFKYFPMDAVPTRDELVHHGFPSGTRLVVKEWGVTVEKALALLHSKGFKGGDPAGTIPTPTDRVYVESVFGISHPEFRAIAKIAFNYLAAMAGEAIARMPDFNEVREYIRHEKRPPKCPVRLATPLTIERVSSGRTVLGHYVTLQTVGHVLSQVSLHTSIRYVVTLSKGPFLIPWKAHSGHIFDLETRTAVQVVPPPLPRGEA